MKRTILLAAGLALTLVTGCVVTSVYPYYTPKDLTFDPALLGVWSEPEKTNTDSENWKFEQVDPRTYKLTVHDTDKDTEYDAHLFKLKEYTFLDCLPRERTDCLTPSHALLRMDNLKPELKMSLLKYDWLEELIKKNPKAIRHVIVPKEAGKSSDDGLVVLTADTVELQQFVLKYVKTADAWSDPLVMKQRP